ncbi:hypothetical protein HMI56_006935 [Coelomomyces lativittatus]|nr:hypothetical protein HMI56_006935 [Coelomomyces lativittatus]
MKPPMKVQEISSSAKEMQSPQTEIEYFSNSMKENSLEEQVSALNENAKSLEEAVQKLGIEKMEFVRIQEELIQEKFTLISELNTIRSQKEDLEAQLHSYEELIEHQPKELLSTPEISTRTISHPLPTDALLDSPNTISKGIKQNSSYDNLLQEAEELRKKLDLAHESQQRLENFEKENNEKALICEAQEFKIQSLSHLLEEQTKSLSENNLKIKSLESNLSEYEPFKELYILSQNALYLAKDQVDSLQLEKQKLMGVIEELHIELNIAQMDVEALRLQENLPNVSIEQTAEEKRDSWIVALNTVEIDSSKEIEKLKKEMEDMKKKLDYTNGLLEQAEARSSQVVTLLETLKSKSIELTNLEAELANLKSGKLTTTNREIPIDELPENMKETSVVSNEMELKIQDLIMEKDAALEKLELKIVELEQDKHDLLKKLETLELELQDSNFTRENLDNKLKTKEEGFISTITKEQEIHTILSSELETTKKQYKDLEVELERLRFQNHNDLKRSSAYNELLAKCINLEMITESIKKENTTLMENLKQVEESLMSKEEKERANEPFLAEANAKILNFEHQIEENQRIIEELISFKANHQETLSLVEDLQNQSRESNIRIKELSDQLEVALSVKESLRQELEGLSEMLHTVLKEVQGPQEDSEIFKSTNISDQSKLSALGSICHELRQKLASAYEEVETKNEAFNSVEKQLDYALAAKENAQMELMKLSEQLEVLQKEKENSISAVSTSRFLDNDKDKNGGMSLNISGNEFISPHFEASEQREKNPIIFSPSAASLSNDPSQHYLTPEDEFQMKEGQTNVVSLEKEIDDLRMRIAATVDYEYKHTLLCTLLARSRGLEPNNPFQDDKKESLHLPVKRISTFEPMPFSHSIPSLEAFLPSPEYLSEQNHDPVIEKTADLQNRAQLLYASCQDTLESIKKHMEDLEERTEEVQKKEKALEAMVSKFVMLRTTLQQHQSRLQPNVHNPSPSISSSNGSDDFLIAKKGNEPLETEKSFDSDADTESLYHDSLSSRDKTIQSILSGALSQEIQPTSDLIAEIQSKILSTQRKSNEVTSFNQSYEKEYIEVKEKIQKKLNSLSKNSTNDSEQRTLSEWIEVYDQELQNTWEEERMKLMHASEKTIELLTSDFEDQERVLLGRLKSQKALVLQLQEEKALLTDNLSTLEAECEKLQVLFEKCEDEAEEREEELLTELAKANMNHKLSEKETHELKSEIQSLRNNLQELEQKSKPLTMNETELEREYKKLEEKLLHYDDQMNEIMQKNMELVMQLSQYK